MLPEAAARVAALPADARVLDVGGWAAPLPRADVVIDAMPYPTRGLMGRSAPGEERFTEADWVVHVLCAREPWPLADDAFDLAVCTWTLEDVRDPVGVCRELSRVARAGYVEVPTVLAELVYGVQGPWLGHEHHRWLCDREGDGLVFAHKAHSLHSDWRVRVVPRWHARMSVAEQVHAIWWERELPARERLVIGETLHDELAGRVRERFAPSPRELRAKELRERGRHVVAHARRPLRAAAERALGG